jgi:hypothetical protein
LKTLALGTTDRGAAAAQRELLSMDVFRAHCAPPERDRRGRERRGGARLMEERAFLRLLKQAPPPPSFPY